MDFVNDFAAVYRRFRHMLDPEVFLTPPHHHHHYRSCLPFGFPYLQPLVRRHRGLAKLHPSLFFVVYRCRLVQNPQHSPYPPAVPAAQPQTPPSRLGTCHPLPLSPFTSPLPPSYPFLPLARTHAQAPRPPTSLPPPSLLPWPASLVGPAMLSWPPGSGSC